MTLQDGDFITVDFYDSGDGLIMGHGIYRGEQTLNGEDCLEYEDYGVMYKSRAFVPMSNLIKIGLIDEETFLRLDGRMSGTPVEASDGSVVTKGGTRDQWLRETDQYIRKPGRIEVVSGGNDAKLRDYKTN